jgi:hypothetical protein
MAGITTQYFATAFLNKSDFLPSITKKVEGDDTSLLIDYDLKNVTATKINPDFLRRRKKNRSS